MNNPNQQKPNQQQQNNPRPGEQYGGGGQSPVSSSRAVDSRSRARAAATKVVTRVVSRAAPTARRQAAHPSRLVFTGHSLSGSALGGAAGFGA